MVIMLFCFPNWPSLLFISNFFSFWSNNIEVIVLKRIPWKGYTIPIQTLNSFALPCRSICCNCGMDWGFVITSCFWIITSHLIIPYSPHGLLKRLYLGWFSSSLLIVNESSCSGLPEGTLSSSFHRNCPISRPQANCQTRPRAARTCQTRSQRLPGLAQRHLLPWLAE